MKKSELKQIIREEIQRLNEGNKIKPKWSLVKKWWNTVDDNGYDHWSKYPPKEWDNVDKGVDVFKDYIQNNLRGDESLYPTVAKMFGLPSDNLRDFLNDGGSGLNGDKYYKKYDNWRAALYDIYEEVKRKMK